MNHETLDVLINHLLPLAQRGDQRAFGQIVVACQAGISAIALAMVRDVSVSEDIAQDAFVKAWHKLPQLNKPSSFLPWLRQITRNLARDHLRARKREQRCDDFDTVLATVADPDPSHVERMCRQEEETVIADLLDELPEDTRELLLIYYREGQSSKQVAELLGLSDAAVRKRLSRARQSLHADLIERLGRAARACAPGAAFTALVLTGVAMSAPAAASGLAGGVGAASKGLGKWASSSESLGRLLAKFGAKFAPKWLSVSAATVGEAAGRAAPKLAVGAGAAGRAAPKFLIGVLGGVFIALLIGMSSLFFGLRRYWVTAIDEQERRDLRNFGILGSAVVLLFCGLMLFAALHDSNLLASTGFVALILGLGLMNVYGLPRVLARRHALESRIDPERAASLRLDERRQAWIGTLVGTLVGGLGMLVGMFGHLIG